MDVSIVTPVFNEEKNIPPFFSEVYEVIDNLDQKIEVIAVDDGSVDLSKEKLKKESRERNFVKFIRLQGNHGQSIALQAGLDRSQGDIVVTIDSDMQNDPKDIPDLIEELKDSESHMVNGFRRERNDPLTKKIPSSLASKMRRSLFENDIRDYGCTLKAFEREAVESLSLHRGMHRYIPVLLESKGFEVTELRVNHRERYSGNSKYGFRRIPKGFIDMIDLWLEKQYGKNFIRNTQEKPEYSIEKVIE